MRRVMEPIIGESQSAFVKGRNIMVGIVVLNEVIEEAKQRKQKRIFFKVDFAKAYDSVDWEFLFDMLECLNFPPKWRSWIRECISSASANVLVNGSPSGEFYMQRGLRQGDPLSPFLFLVVAEGLNLLIGRAVERGILLPVMVGRAQIPISHLQYADDTIFLVEGNVANARVIKGILDLFKELSGLAVNYEKCAVSAMNIGEEVIHGAINLFGCRKGELPMDYLGMKVGGGLNRLVNWEGILKKLSNRLGAWRVKELSLGGRATLISSVLSAIPIYRMGFSKMPEGIAKKCRTIQRSFLWGEGGEGQRKVAWIQWKDLCQKKEEGGLGFKNLKWFNAACLGKWCWRLLVDNDKLWTRVLKSRYGDSVGLRDAVRGRTLKAMGEGGGNRSSRQSEGETGAGSTRNLRGWWEMGTDAIFGTSDGKETSPSR